MSRQKSRADHAGSTGVIASGAGSVAVETRVGLSGTLSDDLAPADGAGQVVFLSWVPEDRIPAGHRAFVRRHVDRAARLMGIVGHVRVRWFGPAVNGGDFTGPQDGPAPDMALCSSPTVARHPMALNASQRPR